MKKRRWIWVILFTLFVALLGTLATVWNVQLVQNYQNWLELARKLPAPTLPEISPQISYDFPWVRVFLGTLGFLALLGASTLFFVKILREMKLNQLQSEFIAAVSHELKTPLATLELTSAMLKDPSLPEDQRAEMWRSHGAELARLKKEVETLLEAARWQVQAPEPVFSHFNLEAWIEKNWESWQRILGPQAVFKREGVKLEFQVKSDPILLSEIVTTLLDNARKFANGRPEVILRTKRMESTDLNLTHATTTKKWRIEIQDQGWGFNPDDAEMIFKRFARSQSQAPYAIPGTGLGLFLATQVAALLKIELKGTSHGAGKGALFKVEGNW